MREAAHLAVAVRRALEIEKRECIGFRRARLHPEFFEEMLADQMRRAPLHRTDANIDARLTEEHRAQLRVRIRHMKDTRIARRLEVIERRTGRAAGTRQRQDSRHRYR